MSAEDASSALIVLDESPADAVSCSSYPTEDLDKQLEDICLEDGASPRTNLSELATEEGKLASKDGGSAKEIDFLSRSLKDSYRYKAKMSTLLEEWMVHQSKVLERYYVEVAQQADAPDGVASRATSRSLFSHHSMTPRPTVSDGLIMDSAKGHIDLNKRVSSDGEIVQPFAACRLTGSSNGDGIQPSRESRGRQRHYVKSSEESCTQCVRDVGTNIMSAFCRPSADQIERNRRTHLNVMLANIGIEQPSPTKLQLFLERVIQSWVFDTMCALMIITNSVIIGLGVEHLTKEEYEPLPIRVAGHACSAFFFVELIMRMLCDRCAFFFDGANKGWNMFDFLLVSVSIVDVVMESLSTHEKGSSTSIGAAVKTIKMIRILRVFRLFRFFRELTLLTLMIMDSLKSLMWALVLLSIILYVFAVVFTESATSYLKEVSDGSIEASDVRRQFGSLGGTVYSLVMTMLGGINWGVLTDTLMRMDRLAVVVFFFYVSFTMLAVLNIITGVFVDNAVETARSQRDVLVDRERAAQEMYVAEMRELFLAMDEDRSGGVTWEELKMHTSDDRVKCYMKVLGLHVEDTERIFRLLDLDESGAVDVKEFLEGCVRLKGEARSIDVHSLIGLCKRIDNKVERLLEVTAIRGGSVAEMCTTTSKKQDWRRC